MTNPLVLEEANNRQQRNKKKGDRGLGMVNVFLLVAMNEYSLFSIGRGKGKKKIYGKESQIQSLN